MIRIDFRRQCNFALTVDNMQTEDFGFNWKDVINRGKYISMLTVKFPLIKVVGGLEITLLLLVVRVLLLLLILLLLLLLMSQLLILLLLLLLLFRKEM